MELDDKTLRRVQEIELEIFDEFRRICAENSLSYFLSNGTCLGAIRHQGFIPWDDDIDIGMLRDDYDKLVEVCHKDLNSSYVFQSMETEANCGLVFGKIRKRGTVFSETYSSHIDMSQGVWIDIFPYDKIPTPPLSRALYLKKVSLLRKLYIVKCGYRCPEGTGRLFLLVYLAAKLFCSFIPASSLIRALRKEMTRYRDDQSCEDVIPFGGAYAPSKAIESLCQCGEQAMVVFEDRECTTFKNFEEHLFRHYGNYMELPPEEDRHAGMHYVNEVIL